MNGDFLKTSSYSNLTNHYSMNEVLKVFYDSIAEKISKKSFVRFVGLEKNDCTLDCSPCDDFTNILIIISYKNQEYLEEINQILLEQEEILQEFEELLGLENNYQEIIDLIVEVQFELEVADNFPNDKEKFFVSGGLVIKNEHGEDGSLGIIGKDSKSNDFFILSAMHVLYGDGEFNNNRKTILLKLGPKKYVPIGKNFLFRDELNALSGIDTALAKVNDETVEYLRPGVLNYQNLKVGPKQLKLCRSVIRAGRILQQ